MARIKRPNKDHLLVGYKTVPGGPELYWRCRDQADFTSFCALEATYRSAGTPVPDPVEIFGEVPRRRGADKGEEARHAHQPKRSAPLADTYTLAQWVGDPYRDAPGPFFKFAKSMGDAQKRLYQSVVSRYAGHMKHKPMDQIDFNDACLVRDKMLICPACVARAEAAGRKDLLEQAPVKLSSLNKPWDGSCVDADGVSAHYALVRKPTLERTLVLFNAMCCRAIEAGRKGLDPRVGAVTTSLFKDVPVPQFPSRPSNDERSEALSHLQLAAVAAAMPDELEASVLTCAHGLMRRSELLGMDRGAIRWPEPEVRDGQAVVSINQVYLNAKGGPELRMWGKTLDSTREPIPLSAMATAVLRAHVEHYCSTPDPERCGACRVGIGEHLGTPGLNPHRGCDFANESPIWRGAAAGERIGPEHFSRAFGRACKKASLTVARLGFRPTVKLLRATGATLLLEAGIEVELVMRMGRWTDVETLRRHYHRVRDEHKAEAVRTLDGQARAELGLPGASDAAGATQEALSARLEAMVSRCAALEATLREMGASPDDAFALERVTSGRRSRFGDDDQLREIIKRAPSRKAILDELGVAAAKKNYAMLKRRAEELGVELPELWAPQRNGKSQDVQATVSVATAG